MMTSSEVVDAVAAWCRQVLPALQADYAYAPAAKGALPDVVVEHTTIDLLTSDDGRFPRFDLQQTPLRVHNLALSFMVDNTHEESAAADLRALADALTASLWGDDTLGDRVPMASPRISFDFTGPYVRYQDGSKGREVTADLAVGDPIEVE